VTMGRVGTTGEEAGQQQRARGCGEDFHLAVRVGATAIQNIKRWAADAADLRRRGPR
jgi:hypothetical protein